MSLSLVEGEVTWRASLPSGKARAPASRYNIRPARIAIRLSTSLLFDSSIIYLIELCLEGKKITLVVLYIPRIL